jgi:hypothetical protein
MYYKNYLIKILSIKNDDEFLLELFNLISIYEFEYKSYPYQIIYILMNYFSIDKTKLGLELFKSLYQNNKLYEFYFNDAIQKLDDSKKNLVDCYVCNDIIR